MTERAKVLVCDGIKEDGVACLRPEYDVEIAGSFTPAELAAKIGAYDAVLVRSQTKVTKEVFAAAKQLKVVARAGVGVDNIDLRAAKEAGVIVVNSPDGNTVAAAEQTLALMFAVCRYTAEADATMKARKWDKKALTGVELNRKVLGVVGLGKIGSHVAMVAKALGMTVLAFDPTLTPAKAAEKGVQIAELEELLAKADIVTLHSPLNAETKHMINAQRLAMMKPSARIVNAGRGGLIDEQALAEAIKAGKLAGAALDVFEQEPLGDSPLYDLGKKVVMAPHLGASTAEAQEKVAVDVAEQVGEILRGGKARSPVTV